MFHIHDAVGDLGQNGEERGIKEILVCTFKRIFFFSQKQLKYVKATK